MFIIDCIVICIVFRLVVNVTKGFFVFVRLQNLEEDLIVKNVKLIIVDSIASLVRKEFDSRGPRNMIERTNLLAKEAAILKYLAAEFKIPVSFLFIICRNIIVNYF